MKKQRCIRFIDNVAQVRRRTYRRGHNDTAGKHVLKQCNHHIEQYAIPDDNPQLTVMQDMTTWHPSRGCLCIGCLHDGEFFWEHCEPWRCVLRYDCGNCRANTSARARAPCKHNPVLEGWASFSMTYKSYLTPITKNMPYPIEYIVRFQSTKHVNVTPHVLVYSKRLFRLGDVFAACSKQQTSPFQWGCLADGRLHQRHNIIHENESRTATCCEAEPVPDEFNQRHTRPYAYNQTQATRLWLWRASSQVLCSSPNE